MWVATLEAKFPSPRNSSGFIVATTMASGASTPASARAARAASAMSSGSGSLRRPIRVMPTPATNTRGMTPIIPRTGPAAESGGGPPSRAGPGVRRRDDRGPVETARSDGGVAATRRWRRRRHAELADEAQQVCALQAEGAGGVGAVAAHLLERRLDQPALEVGDGAVITERAREQRRDGRSEERRVGKECRSRWA